MSTLITTGTTETLSTPIISSRPLLEKMLLRSETNWGYPPSYTPEYRKIRWPGVPYKENQIAYDANVSLNTPQPTITVLRNLAGEIIHTYDLGNTETAIDLNRPRAVKPLWKSNLHYETNRKSNGTWNARDRAYLKADTAASLCRDLMFCMRQNIPLKTKSIEYRPSDTSVYIKDVKVLKYDLYTGTLKSFTYGGVYDKVISLILRKYFSIQVKLFRNKLFWYADISTTIPIDIDSTYDLQKGIDISRNLTIINTELLSEYGNSEGSW